jgi:hypothetical protein
MAQEGILSTKVFVDFLCKTANTSNSFDLLSENYANADMILFQQLASLIDPFETGILKKSNI